MLQVDPMVSNKQINIKKKKPKPHKEILKNYQQSDSLAHIIYLANRDKSMEANHFYLIRDRASLVAQLVKNLPAMQETLV